MLLLLLLFLTKSQPPLLLRNQSPKQRENKMADGDVRGQRSDQEVLRDHRKETESQLTIGSNQAVWSCNNIPSFLLDRKLETVRSKEFALES